MKAYYILEDRVSPESFMRTLNENETFEPLKSKENIHKKNDGPGRTFPNNKNFRQ